jgi:hypothetical protein
MLRRLTSAHKAAKGATGFSQLLIHAFQASNKLSSAKPGKSGHATGTHRLLVWPIAPPAAGGTLAAGALLPGWLVGAPEGATTTGALPQAASIPTMQATLNHAGNENMTLLLLEALGAGLLLVGIIWWTMFSGRKNGEITQAATSAEAPDAEILDKK